MTIETMDPEQSPRPTAMERITAAAEAGGKVRREKIMNALDRVLGAPEAVGMAKTIAGETVRDLKERAINAFNESADRMANRIDAEADRLANWVDKTKTDTLNKVNAWSDKAVKFGLTKATALEDRVVAVFNIPAVLTEKIGGVFEAKAAAEAGKLLAKSAEQQRLEEMLTADQKAAFEAFLKYQAEEREEMKVEHKTAADKIQGKIESAKGAASSLDAKAGEHRAWVAKKRIFSKWLAAA